MATMSALRRTRLSMAYLYVGDDDGTTEYRWRPGVNWEGRPVCRFFPRRWRSMRPPQWVAAHIHIPEECRP